jgi:hypothetical protein
MTPPATAHANSQVEQARVAIHAAWPAELDDGVRCGLLEKFEGAREPGGYPLGFHNWLLERRNAWFAGFNIGLVERWARHD